MKLELGTRFALDSNAEEADGAQVGGGKRVNGIINLNRPAGNDIVQAELANLPTFTASAHVWRFAGWGIAIRCIRCKG